MSTFFYLLSQAYLTVGKTGLRQGRRPNGGAKCFPNFYMYRQRPVLEEKSQNILVYLCTYFILWNLHKIFSK